MRLVVSFHTTTEAMAMKRAAGECHLLGRLIPIPRQLSAGCGLAWSEPATNEPELEKAIERFGLEYERISSIEP